MAFAFAGVSIGQEPPPPPLIYKIPDKASLKPFISEDSVFEAVFPGDPTIKATDTDDFKLISYQTYKDGSRSMVVVYHYNVNIDGNKPNLYAVIRENALRYPKATIESEIEIKNGEIEGREFNILSDYLYKRMRVFAKGKTLYVVSCDVTNWHILTSSYKEKVADFKAESERFMNSFKIK